MKTMNIAIAVLLFGFLISCKDSGTNPTPVIKTPRQMTWTADTLPVPQGAIQVLPEDMLVVSPSDIWLAIWVGHGQIMHYDGKEWKMVKEIGGGIDCLVQGNSNDIWAGGYIGHQNGSQFTQTAYLGNYNGVSWYGNELSIQSEILDITKDPDGNIWACGRNGVILKYDKTKWIADTIKIKFQYPVEYYLKSIEYYNNKIFVLATSINRNTLLEKYYYIYGDINNWIIADSMTFDSSLKKVKWGNFGLYSSKFNKLYSFGDVGSWIYDNGNWSTLNNSTATIYGMYGINENYLYATGNVQQILFYAGTSWENISAILGVTDSYFKFKNVWTDGYETVIVGYGVLSGIQKTIIWHGK